MTWIKGNRACIDYDSVAAFYFSFNGSCCVVALLKPDSTKELTIMDGFDSDAECSKWLYEQIKDKS